jgi:hypothetical protein
MNFSSQENSTEWAAATGAQMLMPTFVDRRVSCDQHGGTPTSVNLSFLDRIKFPIIFWNCFAVALFLLQSLLYENLKYFLTNNYKFFKRSLNYNK